MLRLDLFAPAALTDEICAALVSLPGVRHVTPGPTTTDGLVAVSAEVAIDSADAAIDRLADFGIASDDLTLWRLPGIQPLGWRRGVAAPSSDTQVWAEIVGQADEHSKLAAAYLVFMVTAGAIAGIGVVTGSAVLLVGAMAISPDLLPVSASAIGIVERRWHLTARALRSLTVGLATGAAGAFAVTAIMLLFGQIPDDLVLADTAMGDALTHLGPGSLIVAVAAGVAGMMAFERPGGAAVGVAISVTTIPAAAYIGAALAMGRDDPMFGAMQVLFANVVLLVVASAATLLVQRRLRQRRAASAQAAEERG